jgi:hypothetical protein
MSLVLELRIVCYNLVSNNSTFNYMTTNSIPLNEEEAIKAVFQGEQEVSDGKLLRGGARDILVS